MNTRALAVDVAVVGGGIAGISLAGELGRGGDLSVAVLEQEPQLAYHTSGRSAAAFLETYGSTPVRALTRASRPLFDEAGPGEATPLLSPRRLLWVASAGGLAALDHLVRTEPLLRCLEPAQARGYCPQLRDEWLAGAAAEDGAQDIDVAGLFERYRRLAVHHGVHILTGAKIHSGSQIGPDWLLQTTVGPVRAGVVVNAAGAWADEFAGMLGVAPIGLVPLRRTVAIATSDAVDRGWPLVCEVTDTFYFRPEGADLLLSPADETPSEPGDARPDTVDVALALERANEATTLNLRHVRTSWAGLRTFAPDRNPVVGMDPGAPGFFWLAGQGGYGMQTAPAMASLAAALVRDDPAPRELATVVDALSPRRFLGGDLDGDGAGRP